MKNQISSRKTSSSAARPSLDQGGFSLLEVLIVTAIIIIMSAIAVGSFFQTRLYAPEDQAVKMMELFRSAHQSAITTASIKSLTIDISPTVRNATVVDVATGNVEAEISLIPQVQIGSAPPSVGSGNVPNPPNYPAASISTSWSAFFNPDGSVAATAGGVVPLSATLYFWHPDQQEGTLRAVTMFGGTGAVRLWSYGTNCTQNGSWCK